MNKTEAIQAMLEGKKITHRFFSNDEWVMSNTSGTLYTLEDGVQCSADEFWQYRKDDFWNNDWEIFIEQPTEPDFEDTDEPEFQCCDNCDLPDACADFGCAIKTGVRKTPLDYL